MENVIALLKKVTGVLETHDIPYMLSGSLAMTFYAVSRSTLDIDLVVNLKESDVEKLINYLPDMYHHRESMQQEIRNRGMFNMIDFETGCKIDFIVMKNDTYSIEAFARRQRFDDFGQSISVIAIEDLIIAKLKWIQMLFSERQAQDISWLFEQNNVNIAYVKDWCQQLNLNTYQLIPQ